MQNFTSFISWDSYNSSFKFGHFHCQQVKLKAET